MRSRSKELHLFILVLLLPQLVAPATITVDGQVSDATPGVCDLVEAIGNANNDDAANTDCEAGSGADEIVLTVDPVLTERFTGGALNGTGLPLVSTDITVQGGDHTVSRDAVATDLFRLFQVSPGGDLTLSSVTVSGGLVSNPPAAYDARGGGILNYGTLTMTNSTVSGNTATGVAPNAFAYGGGIYNGGDMTITGSTVSGNLAEAIAVGMGLHLAFGGGISNGTFFYPIGSPPSLAITGSTISGNSSTAISGGVSAASAYGGGLYLAAGDTTLTNSTVSTNSATATQDDGPRALGGGILIGDSGTILRNVTVSSNSVAAGPGTSAIEGGAGIEYFGVLNPGSNLSETILGNHSPLDNCAGFDASFDALNNLADDGTCATIPATLTLLDATLNDNGGPTETHALMAGSSAIDEGDDCGLATDQRGVARPVGFCDSGSYELIPCAAPDGQDFVLSGGTTTTVDTYEACNSITVDDHVVIGPGGHLILRTAGVVSFGEGFEVGVDGQLTVELDPGIVMPSVDG